MTIPPDIVTNEILDLPRMISDLINHEVPSAVRDAIRQHGNSGPVCAYSGQSIEWASLTCGESMPFSPQNYASQKNQAMTLYNDNNEAIVGYPSSLWDAARREFNDVDNLNDEIRVQERFGQTGVGFGFSWTMNSIPLSQF
jgi:hypothetical protein